MYQAAAQAVQLPTTVMAACKITSQLRVGELSKKCQVQAHMALIKAGSMPKDNHFQADQPLTSANCQTK